MNFSDGTTKQMRTKIVHKSYFYTLIGQVLYFCGRGGILRRTMGKTVVPKLVREFHEDFCGGHFAKRVVMEINHCGTILLANNIKIYF